VLKPVLTASLIALTTTPALAQFTEDDMHSIATRCLKDVGDLECIDRTFSSFKPVDLNNACSSWNKYSFNSDSGENAYIPSICRDLNAAQGEHLDSRGRLWLDCNIKKDSIRACRGESGWIMWE
jgi:hypothetical protein